ncbi:hypothetical protein CEQ11_005115 [Micrococcus sp. FDAARGOS_333]|nr:hypothetical protein CEQ11_005115 [Micrococcus sp. FDAARGOS_333]
MAGPLCVRSILRRIVLDLLRADFVINNGGRARVTIRTRDGSLFNVVVDDHDQADRLVEDVRSIRARSSG